MIVLVCGPPASGKTTLATGLHRRLAARGHAVGLLHSDDYERHPYERMYERVAAEGTEDRHWILDGTFFRRELRNRFYRLDETYEVWVRASLETCLERNRERADPIPEAGVRAMYGKFEPPRADLELDTERLSAEAALDRLEGAALGWLED